LFAISIESELTPQGADSYMLGLGAPVGPNPAPILLMANPFSTLPIDPPPLNPLERDIACPLCLILNSASSFNFLSAAGVRAFGAATLTAE